MKLKFIISVVIVAFLVVLFLPTYKHDYFYSKDKKQCVTKFEYQSSWFDDKQTYFIAGYYPINKIPKSYISPHSVDHDRYWNVVIHFAEGKIYFVKGVGICDVKNNNDKFTFVETSASSFTKSQIFLIKALQQDRSINTYRVESYHTE